MPAVVGIANGHLAVQFNLAGIAVSEASTPDETREAINAALSSAARVVMVQEDLDAALPELFRAALRQRQALPLVVVCPAFETEASGVLDYVSRVVRPAVGYEIRVE
ncbi:MAG: hypothetical protein GY851_05240 [bacterium]|nr:hypothetical protein [bacterium]